MTTETQSSPAELVAIARAAWAIGDRDLERAAKRELMERYGITIQFPRRPAPKRGATR